MIPLRVLSALLSLIVALTSKSAADTLTFQQGVGGYTSLKQTTLFQLGAGASAVNGGLAAGTWTVDGGSASYNDGQFKQGLIWFDNIFGSNPGQIPLGSTITSATITATYDDPSSTAFAVYRMLQTWSPASATWNSFTGGVQNDGTEAAAAATTTFSNPNGNASGTYNAYGTSLTADLQLFSNGTPNYGWVVLPTSGTSGWGWSAAQTNSAVLSVTFTPPASVLSATITSPANSATVGQSFTITATASAVSPATVTSVTFKDGATVLGVDTTSPYSWDVTGAALGSHSLTAVVTDSNSATATSSPVNVTVVNTPPTVAITSPANGATVPTTFTIDATAADSDGTITSVAFYDGATLLFTDTTSPYSYTWSGASVGAHVLTAVALDNSSTTTISAAVNVTVTSNNPPVITLTSPAALANVTTASTMLTANIADPEGDAQTVTFYGRVRAPITPGPDFTFIAIPDTQYYSENRLSPLRNPGPPSNSGANISYFNDQTDWITANRISRNIPFVAHMGDMVQNGDSIDAEWVRADGAMQRIENPVTTLLTHGIPWGGAPGNHDIGVTGSLGTGTTAKWNQYFGTARWAGRLYFGGVYDTINNTTENNYQFFRASGLDFLVINLAYRTTADTAVHDWADALMKAYPNHRVILTSHWIINTGNPATFGGQGQALYDNLKDNPNFFLMLCGHVHGDGRRSDVFQGRTIYSVLSDFQDGANGGNGFLRTLVFSPANNRITTEMYSPTLGRTATVGDSPTYQGTYTMDYNMQGALTDWIPLGTVNVPANGTTASLNWTGLQAGKTYEWYAVSNDGVFSGASTVRRFITPIGAPPTVAITSPANNTTYFAPFTVNLTATAGDTDGTIAKVEFYRDATKIGEDTSAPYEATANGLGLGTYAFTAVATDDLGNTTTSSIVNVSANALDTDGDGIPDSYETAHGLNPANPADAVLDGDGDGVSNRNEFIFGTAADVPDRYTYSATYNSPAGTATVTFATSTGRTYRVQYSNTLGLGSWLPGSGVVVGTGAPMQWIDDGTVTGSLPSVAGRRYYRIEGTVVP